MPILIGVLVVAAVVYYFVSVGDGPDHDESDPEQDLRLLCRGDQKLIERLVALEMTRAPTITRGEAVKRAITSLRRDHR